MRIEATPQHVLLAARITLACAAVLAVNAGVRLAIPPPVDGAHAISSPSTRVQDSVKPIVRTVSQRRTASPGPLRNPFVVAADTLAAAAASAPPAPPRIIPPMTLIGTVQHADGGQRAIVQIGGDVKLVKVGQAIDQFVVKAIKRGQVRVASSDTSLTLRMTAQ